MDEDEAPRLPPEAPARTGTGLIVGRVVEGTSTQGVPGAVVNLSGAGAKPQRVQSDDDGRFVFRDLPAGTLVLMAIKTGYIGGMSGQRIARGPNRPVELADGERLGDVTLRLWKPGAVSGTITDDRGEPVPGLQVLLSERILFDGRRQLSGPRTAVTDDRGLYRFGTVGPGEYIVFARSEPESGRALMSIVGSDMSAAMSIMSRAMGTMRPEDLISLDPSLMVYPPTFYPAVLSASQASPVAVRSGEDRSGIDLRVKLVPMGRISGTVTDQGQPVAQMMIRLLLADEPGHEIAVTQTSTGADGRFAFIGVPDGRYVVQGTLAPRGQQDFSPMRGAPAGGRGLARGPLPAGPTLSVAATVATDDPGAATLALVATRGVAWRGRVVFEGSAPPPAPDALQQIGVTIVTTDATRAFGLNLLGRVEPDGTLMTLGVPPGQYRLRAVAPSPWRLKSAMAGGRDVADVALEADSPDAATLLLTFVDRPDATLSGTVRNARGDADPDAIVFIFPADERQRTDFTAQSRRIRAARTTKAGLYAIPGLPAGDYFVAVGADEAVDGWLEPATLERLSRGAVRVQIVDGVNKSQDLRGGGK